MRKCVFHAFGLFFLFPMKKLLPNIMQKFKHYIMQYIMQNIAVI